MPVMLEMVVSMEARLAVAAFELVDDGTANVSQVCRRLGISRDTFYRYRRLFEASGWRGLLPVSSRPHASPGRTAASVEELILTERHRLLAQGWDGGARSIHARLTRVGSLTFPRRAPCTAFWSVPAWSRRSLQSDPGRTFAGSSTTDPTPAGRSTAPAG